MKPGKLYIKFFIVFLLFLMVMEIAIFGFFVLFAGREYRHYFEKHNDAKFKMAQELLGKNLKMTSHIPLRENLALDESVQHLGDVFNAKIWLTHEDNSLIFKSFEGRIPYDTIEKFNKRKTQSEEFDFQFASRHHLQFYMTEPLVASSNNNVILHMLFWEKPSTMHQAGFAIGLVSIGLIVALLAFPVSRHISKPIKNLTVSTQRIEKGDLSHRTTIKSRDEIGDLGKAFNRMAEKVENMIKSGKELTAQVSHELRSPLARIQIAVELLKDRLASGDDKESVEHIYEIQEEIDELDHLIGRILELSKLDLRESISYDEQFSPGFLLNQLFQKFDSLIKNKNISLSFDLLSADNMSGNLESFTMAMSNLVDNACKYSPAGGAIKVWSKKEKNTLHVSISNHCSQISKEDMDRIFEPFFRVDPTEKSGGGLGLAITKKIIEKHGGTIKAISTGQGLEMSILLPLGTTSS